MPLNTRTTLIFAQAPTMAFRANYYLEFKSWLALGIDELGVNVAVKGR